MQPKRSIRAASAAFAAAALAACATVGSIGVETSAVEPRIRLVVDEGGTARISVALLTGFANALELEGGEVLTARIASGAPVALTAESGEAFGASTAYAAVLDGATPGDEVVLSWSRTDQVSAPATRIAVPASLGGVATVGAAFDFDDDVAVTWTPDGTGDDVDVRLRLVACDGLDADQLEAARFFAGFPVTFPIEDGAATFEPVLVIGAATSCTAVLEVGRATLGIDLDPAFGGLRDRSSAVQLGAAVPLTFAAP